MVFQAGLTNTLGWEVALTSAARPPRCSSICKRPMDLLDVVHQGRRAGVVVDTDQFASVGIDHKTRQVEASGPRALWRG